MRESRAPLVDVALAIPSRGDRFLVTLRAERNHLGGLWEFPGGKIRPAEEPLDAARREMVEETGLRGGIVEPLLVFIHDYPDRAVRLHCFVVQEPGGELMVDGARKWAWVRLEELNRMEMPAANASILRALIRRVGSTIHGVS